MRPTHKAVAVAAVVALLVGALWTWKSATAVGPQAVRTSSTQSNDEPAPPSGARELALDSERAEVSLPSTAESAQPLLAERDSRFGSLRLRVLWADDKTPAAGIWMRLFQRGADDPYRDTLDARTDERGEVFVERVCAGRVAVKFDRGAQAQVEVEGGRENEAVLEIPAGFDVTGTVIDVDGWPFAGAEIYVQIFGGSHEGFVVAHSGTDGAFAIRALEPRTMTSISARAAGRTPTQQHVCSAEAGVTITLKLAFEALGGALKGRVLAPDGLGVAGARVLVGSEYEARIVPLGDGTFGRPPASQLARTDERGEFRIDGLASGMHALQARVAGFAPWKSEIEIVAGRTSAIDVQLFAGASLSGVVRDENGAPLAGVEVWADSGGAFASTSRRTPADGSYAMHDLPLGEFAVEANGVEGQYAGSTLFGVAGRELRWDPILSSGARLRVQLLAPGSTLAGWRITAEEDPGVVDAYANTQTTNAEGRVEFVNVPDVELRLSLRAPGPHAFPRAVLHGVRASAGEVVIEPDPALEPTVFLRGRIVDPDGRPLGGAYVAPQNPALFYPPHATTDNATGRFELGPFPAGEWSIHAFALGFARLASPSVRLVAHESWDFGDLRLARGGTLVVFLAGACGAADAATIVQLIDGTRWTEQLTLEGNAARSVLVPEGIHRLRVERAGCTPVEREIEIHAGEETQVTVELGAG